MYENLAGSLKRGIGPLRTASTDTAVDRAWLLGVTAVVIGLGAGALSFASVPAAVLLAAAPLVLYAIHARLTLLACATFVFIVGAPVLYLGGASGGSSANPLLSLPLGSSHPPLQVLLPLLMACAAVLTASSLSLSRLRRVFRRGVSGVLLLWVFVTAVLFVFGASTNGVLAAGRDLLFMTMYVWVVVPILVFGRMAERAISFFLSLLLAATALSAAVTVLVFAVPPLQSLAVSGTSFTSSVRVGFSTESVYPLALPVGLLMLGRRGTKGRARALWMTSCILMVAALVIGQTRTTIAVAVLNVFLVALVPGLRKIGIERWRMIVSAIAIGVVLAMALVAANLLGLQAAQTFPQELSHRLVDIVSYSHENTYQSRGYTNSVAFGRWLASPESFLVGEGLGSPLRYYNPVTHSPFAEGPFIDSVWATLAVKGGLVALGLFASVLVAAFAAFVRAALRASDPVRRVVWWALVLSFPGVVFESTAMTNHLLAVPAMVVTVSTLVAAADLCALPDVQFDESG